MGAARHVLMPLLGALALAACTPADPTGATPGATPIAGAGVVVPANAPPPAPEPGAPAQLTFFDSDAFDSQLSAAMHQQAAPIDVITVDGISLNALPKRVNTWLAAVSDRGGQVSVVKEAVDGGQNRGIESIVLALGQAFIETFITAIHNERMYGLAGGYNVVLVTIPPTSQLREIRFVRREN